MQNRSMETSPFEVRAASGSLRSSTDLVVAHVWTAEGIVAGPATNGAQLLHLSVAVCVLNDIYREAQRLGIDITGVAVVADGGFDSDWRTTGIRYSVEVDSPAPGDEIDQLIAVVDQLAEIPRVIRAGGAVARTA